MFCGEGPSVLSRRCFYKFIEHIEKVVRFVLKNRFTTTHIIKQLFYLIHRRFSLFYEFVPCKYLIGNMTVFIYCAIDIDSSNSVFARKITLYFLCRLVPIIYWNIKAKWEIGSFSGIAYPHSYRGTKRISSRTLM